MNHKKRRQDKIAREIQKRIHGIVTVTKREGTGYLMRGIWNNKRRSF